MSKLLDIFCRWFRFGNFSGDSNIFTDHKINERFAALNSSLVISYIGHDCRKRGNGIVSRMF